jgi:dehydration protein DpgD
MKTTIEKPRVQYEKREQVAYITLDRPHLLNAMDLRMHEELAKIWDDFESDDNIRVGVLSGAGEKAFSVGQDLKELANRQHANTGETASFGSRGKPGWPRLTERFNRVLPRCEAMRWAVALN